ncbi:MAG: fibronectin type III domain-containing protein [Acidobacteriaceae bacterium]
MAVALPRRKPRSVVGVLLAPACCLLLPAVLGCGMVASPQPPSLKLPQPVADLTAQRVGNQVNLHWSMPKRATDKVLLQGKQKVILCRAEISPCVKVGDLRLAPQSEASFTDKLPAALSSGPLRPLIYTIELENESGRSAGPSNPAITAAGSAPPQILNLSAHAQPDGIVLTWTPTGATETIRIQRALISNEAAAAAKKTSKSPAQPFLAAKQMVPYQQTLEFTGPDEGRALDPDASLDHTYTYLLQRIEKASIEGRTIEVASAPGASITINARDLFPPATPSGLEAVADSEAHSIDLSWQPDTEPDLAGYRIYRRAAGSAAAPARIGAVAAGPSFRDTTAQPGRSYQYSVTAVDRDGNESPRSNEVEESLP